MKLGGWVRREAGSNRLGFGTDQDLDSDPGSIFPLFNMERYGVFRH